MTLTQPRTFDQGYCNWVKGTLSLLYMKEAIEDVVDTEAVKFHKVLQKDLGIYGYAPRTCSVCTRKDITKGKTWQMQCSTCNDWLQEIVKHVAKRPMQNLKPENTDPKLWPTSPYEVLKCYMSLGCKGDMSAKDGDTQSILNLLRNCDHFTKCRKIGRLNLIDQLLGIRNSLYHAGKLEVTITDLQINMQTVLNFLAGMTNLTPDQSRSVQEAEKKIIELKNNDLDVSFRELELIALKEKQMAFETDIKCLEDKLTEATLETTSTDDAVNTIMEDMHQMQDFRDQFCRFLQENDLEQDLARLSTSIKQHDQTLEKHEKQLTELDSSSQQHEDHISILHQKQQQTEARLQIVERQQGQPAQPQQQTDLDSSFKQEDDHISILYSRQQQTEARLEILERLHDQQAEPQTQRDSQKKNDNYVTGESTEAAFTEEATGSKDIDFDSNIFNSEEEDEDDAMFELRNYQLELAEKAVAGKNTIVCAPTGVGKTWVALHIIRNHLEADTDGSRRVVFIAKTGALTKQQANRIKKHLPQYQTKLLQGDVDNTKIFEQCLRDYQIFCFTPQILVDNLECGSVSSITRLSLIILDECHHTKGDSPYSTLMRKYLMEKYDRRRNEKLPQIVGMTATLGVGKSATVSDAVDYILHMCALLDVTELSTVKICTEELYKYTSKPDEETIPMQPRMYDPASDILRYAIADTERVLKEIALLQPNFTDLICKCPSNKESQYYNKWTYDVMKAAHSCAGDTLVLRNIFSYANYLNMNYRNGLWKLDKLLLMINSSILQKEFESAHNIVYNQALEVNSLLQTEDVIRFLAEKHSADSEQKDKLTLEEHELLRNLTDVQLKLQQGAILQKNINVHFLSGRLRAMLEDGGDDSRAMVFVKARATCKALAMFLEKDLGDIVKTCALHGKYKRGDDEGMPQAVQDETIQRFRDGEYKVLVATSVGVEGIDIPDCNMALNYNFIGNEIIKVQMRGRIRKHGGRNITILKDFDKDRLSAYKELMMQGAMQEFDNLMKADIEMKVQLYQKEERQKYTSKLEAAMAKQRKKTNIRDYKLCCKKCNNHACFISDVRKCKVQHFVIDKDFVNKIDIKKRNKPTTADGFQINRQMRCKKCPLSWGVIADKDGLDCRILKLENFKLINMATGAVERHKKWDDVPYKVQEVDVNDLPRLLTECTEKQL